MAPAYTAPTIPDYTLYLTQVSCQHKHAAPSIASGFCRGYNLQRMMDAQQSNYPFLLNATHVQCKG